MNTNALKKFAQEARRQLMQQAQSRLTHVLATDSPEMRDRQAAVDELKQRIADKGRDFVIEETAYTWFNRLCALRFMDVNHITPVGIVSPQPGFTQPELLQDAKANVFHDEFTVEDRRQVIGLLTGILPGVQPEQQAYRLLLVAACNHYADQMGFLFEKVDHYSELLMPEDLLSSESILQSIRESLTPDVCQDVEVIGWLYQFYISEKKDEVINRRGVVEKQEIPAATQLFTPDWIVRFITQNSLGRLWLQNHPGSRIQSKMEYYIESDGTQDQLTVDTPTELRMLDPACGSGHILTYAFDLLYIIYEEQGYDPADIPALILRHNLFGVEIDQRAAQLAGFALMMKAVLKDRQFLTRGIQPNICLMRDVVFAQKEINAYMERLGRDLWTQDLWSGLKQFENAETFGSLIRPEIKDVPTLRKRMQEKGIFGNLLLSATNEKLEKVLQMAEYLSPRYHAVIANPPYMGGRAQEKDLKRLMKDHYPDAKSDTFAGFISRSLELATSNGVLGFVTPFVWMFISSYEKLREKIIEDTTITALAQLEYNAFAPACIPVCVFTLTNHPSPKTKGGYVRLSDFRGSENQAPKTLEAIANPECGWFYRAAAADFKKIPGAPIAYWVSDSFRDALLQENIDDNSDYIASQNKTANNEKFLRHWYELQTTNITHKKWIFYSKGGTYRKYYGNLSWCVDWSHKARDFYSNNPTSNLLNKKYWFREGISYTDITSKGFNARYFPPIGAYDMSGPVLHPTKINLEGLLAYINSKPVDYALKVFNPTFHCQASDLKAIPVPRNLIDEKVIKSGKILIHISKSDWDTYETSWDFTENPFLQEELALPLSERYTALRTRWQGMTDEIQRLEEENNRLFIDAYGLQDELTPDVPLEEITLTCNPHYRYGGKLTDAQREARLLEDTVKELLSYAVGCIFGRYALQKPSLILANQGDDVQAYERILQEVEVSEKTGVQITHTNLLPILDDAWFADDIVASVQAFLRTAFGAQHYDANLRFIEKALGKKLRNYFLKDFYKDHVQTYKKRPIYWQFSSPKSSFNALIYMHRYESSTLSTVLKYLNEFQEKLKGALEEQHRIADSPASSAVEKSKALKEAEGISKVLKELDDYERNVIYPLATQRIEIDLDDGVSVNYEKFGKALKKF
jgi:type II restriction/modification system DNA methylase subunit YeeA